MRSPEWICIQWRTSSAGTSSEAAACSTERRPPRICSIVARRSPRWMCFLLFIEVDSASGNSQLVLEDRHLERALPEQPLEVLHLQLQVRDLALRGLRLVGGGEVR